MQMQKWLQVLIRDGGSARAGVTLGGKRSSELNPPVQPVSSSGESCDSVLQYAPLHSVGGYADVFGICRLSPVFTSKSCDVYPVKEDKCLSRSVKSPSALIQITTDCRVDNRSITRPRPQKLINTMCSTFLTAPTFRTGARAALQSRHHFWNHGGLHPPKRSLKLDH